MKAQALLAVCVAALIVAPLATSRSYTARTLSDARVGSSKTELVAQRRYSGNVLRFLTHHHWMLATRHASCAAVPWTRTCGHARSLRRAHRWLHDLATRRLAALERPAPTVVDHYAGWACIHSGEGDSASGTYTGYLQMTTPWEGMSYDWYAMGAGVYAVAERVAAAHHFNPAWMSGQWPNTYPRCAGYF